MAARSTKKAHEVVADQVRAQIVRGELVEGQRLPSEDELTVQFGIARTTLREALRVLESQGLISIRRGRGGGPVVTHPSLEHSAMALAVSLQLQQTTIGDLDDARRMIEAPIAGQLAERRCPADVEAIDAAIDLAAEAAERNDPIAFGQAAARVHETLVERSGNVTLVTLSKLLHNMTGAYYVLNIDRIRQSSMRRAVRSYRKLVTLIRAGDQVGATAHWQAQMRYTLAAHDPNEPVTIEPRAS
jgi:GntR family transcriptional regulator, transcriptional repressor for pyruvate dehydrogenase complex